MADLFLNNINTFTKIATENLQMANQNLEKAKNAKSVTEHTDFIMKSREYAIVTIVFSALTLEAYINDYAARNKGISFFEKHLEKIDYVSKWVVIPELVTSRSFPKDKQCYQFLDELKKMRNELVHSKPKNLHLDNEEAVKKVGEEVYAIIQKAEQAVKTIFMVVKCLTELDSDEKQFLLNGANLE